MTPTVQPRTRAEMHRRLTTYEVVAETPAGVIRLGFSHRTGRADLLRLARRHAAVLLPHVSETDQVSYSMRDGLRLGARVVVRKSGRTERDCANAERQP